VDRVGYVLRVSRSRRVIVKLEKEVKEGRTLYDERGRKVGKVIEVFGPIRAPYASLQPLTDRLRGLIGRKVFIR
jgi:RNA-binding protein